MNVRRQILPTSLAGWAAGLSWMLVAAFLPAAAVTEYPLPQPDSLPFDVTLGPDGNAWFTETGANQIGRIAPDGTLTEFPIPTPASLVQHITAGPDGNLWFTEFWGNRIGRITPAGVITEFPLPRPDSQLGKITAGPDGALWFTEANPPTVGRITAGGQITEFPLPAHLILPHGITTGPDGNLWITALFPPSIVRLTPQGSTTTFPLPFALPSTDEAFDIIAGPGGLLWFTNRVGRSIGTITTEGQITPRLHTVPATPYGIARGPDGAIWFHQGGLISEISTTLGVRDFFVGGSSLGFLTAGSDGALWATRRDENRIVRVRFAVTVNDAGDDLHPAGCALTGLGTCTLRDALVWSSAQPGPETVRFAIPGPSVHTLLPTSAFPDLSDVILDATTQPGHVDQPLIELDGTGAGAVSGLVATGGAVAIRGFIVNRFGGDGIRLEGSSRNVVQGNFIGTHATGTSGAFNAGAGIRALAEVDNLIGGFTAADRNVVSGNLMQGIVMRSNTRVLGNYIGLDRTGTVPLGNGGDGILNDHGSGSVVGAATMIPGTPPANVISANGGAGIRSFVFSAGAAGKITVQGNWIGTNTAGKVALGNGGPGVALQGARSAVIGGAGPGERNVISGNAVGIRLGDAGLQATASNVIDGNFIGTDDSGFVPLGNTGCGVFVSDSAFQNRIGDAAAPNTIAHNGAAGVCVAPSSLYNSILGNSIHSNGGLGIDLEPAGFTANDPCDTDAGGNKLQNHPVLTSVSYGAGTTIVGGTLEGEPSTTFRLEFFRNAVCDAAGGEGRQFIGAGTVVTDGSCRGSFSVVLPASVGPTERIAATATDPTGNTSEFSPCFAIAGMQFSTVVPCRVADTREPPGPFGGPSLGAGETRTFAIAGRCGIPASARAVAVNATTVGAQSAGHLVLFPAGLTVPVTSTLNYRAGQARANNGIVPISENGELSVHCAQPAGSVDLLLDVVGYFD